MAIGWRSGNTATGTTNCIVTAPSGLSSGDVMVAILLLDAGTPTAPAGWYRVALRNTVAANPVSAWMKVAGGSEPGTYTFNGGTGVTEVAVDAYTGVDTVRPNDADTTDAGSNVGTVSWPNITSKTDNAWHIAVVGDTTGAVATPAGYTARTSSVTYGDAFSKAITPAGLISGVSSAGGVDWVAISIVLRPLVAAPSANIYYTKG